MLITLLTDFGTQDSFVGVLKGVILSIAPQATVVDLTHHVPPQDIHAGAFALKTASAYFPPGTVHVAVVDPGVGGERRPIAARIGRYYYVCPDNGLLTYILAHERMAQAVVLDNSDYHLAAVSRTFHGRDIFAPVAAHLTRGVLLADLGTEADTLTTLPLSRPETHSGDILSHVLYTDVFGNVLLDVTEEMALTWEQLSITVHGSHISGPLTAYSEVLEGEPLAIFGSSGHLEIAIRNGDAARRLRLRVGDTIVIRRKNPGPEGIGMT